MVPASDPQPLLTLEPLLEAVREGLTNAGWELSGLQKTTSYEFEGRWAGEGSRSAYVFFHREGLPDWVSIDVFLDETSRGLKGNLALVLEGPVLEKVASPRDTLTLLAGEARKALPQGFHTPITLRYRLGRPGEDPAGARTEFRFKLYIPSEALTAGHGSVARLSRSVAVAFGDILDSDGLRPFLGQNEDED